MKQAKKKATRAGRGKVADGAVAYIIGRRLGPDRDVAEIMLAHMRSTPLATPELFAVKADGTVQAVEPDGLTITAIPTKRRAAR